MTVREYIELIEEMREQVYVPYIAEFEDLRARSGEYPADVIQKASSLAATLVAGMSLCDKTKAMLSSKISAGELDPSDEIGSGLASRAGFETVSASKKALALRKSQLEKRKSNK